MQTDKAVEAELLSRMQSVSTKLKELAKDPINKSVENNSIKLTFDTPASAASASQVISSFDKELKVATNQNTITATLPESVVEKIKDEAVTRNIEVLRARFGVEEIPISKQGDNRIVLELPDTANPEEAKMRIGKAAVLEFRVVYKYGSSKEQIEYDYDGIIPGDMEILQGQDEGHGKQFYLVQKYAEVTGKMLKDAQARIGQDRMQPEVSFSLTSEGSDKFYDLTSKNMGKMLAIVLDNMVISAPVIQAAIRSEGMITLGSADINYAKELALLLRSGSFVAPVSFEEERQIGPSLGAESIRQGLISCLVGLGLLFLFSVFFYGFPGILAFIALIYNLLLILLGLSWLNATLTLPGIAGMVLTVGMAIDASILIYEQIKEALAHGMPLRKAIQHGFSDAMVVILDANITTFIVGVVLFYFGTGPIKGFAVTMMLGIISTLITGLFFLRSLFSFILNTFNIQKLKF
ncbi:protein translocase subunit SecD [Candidatus Dependentiae bacterium Noda2021]|nr:protein translocase subunit SecD [Candidatus Dependentiae bacterium Noda2021]